MGWSYGVNTNGREVGYAVEGTCDQDGCDEKINRGLAYACGGHHDEDVDYCAGYFCSRHLVLPRIEDDNITGFRCPDCAERLEKGDDD